LRPSFVPSAAEQRFYFRGLARREIRLPAKAPAYATSFSTDAEGFADVRDDPTAPLPERRWEQNIRFLDAGDSTVYGLHPFIKVKPHGLRPSGEDGFQWAQRTAPREYTVLSAPTLFAEDIPENAVPDDSEETRIPPSDAPPELAELAQKLAAGLTHPQPALIAARIADWLRTTKRVTYAEPEEEIAAANAYDFLLSAQPARRRGRCLQYAGAMALLCRSLGLPARVAVGYAVKSEAAYERSVLVRRADAHAWVEIRWRGLGWALYDPTPGNMPLSRSGPAIPDPLPPELPSDAATQDPSALEKRDVASPAKPNADDETPAAVAATGHWWQRLMKYDRNKQRRFYGWLSRWFANTAETLQALLSGWVGIALQIVAGLIVTALTFHFLRQLYLSFDRREQGMRRKHSSPRARAAVSFYNEYLRLLAKRGMHRRPGQTPREFALTIRRRGGTRFDGAAEVTRLYERVFYGGADLTQNEFNRLQTVFDGLREAALFDVTIDAEITDGDRQP
jgi:transglutaminase-like putative cysteine protease